MITIRGLRKDFGQVAAVDDVSLDVAAGETLVLLGTSGCGKTTTLRMINRLIIPTAGVVRVASRDTATIDPVELRRQIGYMIQGVGLFPHRTVEENVLTVPSLLGWEKSRSRNRLEVLGRLMSLDPAWWRRFPHELSGGQRQRVGLARALAADPPIILMDEPFGALDPITRRQVRQEFRRIEALVNKTIILVTHDIAEAVELGDRICLMAAGRIAQIGTPADLLFRPAGDFVREFFDAERLHTEWMAVKLGDFMESPSSHAGLSARMTVEEALTELERSDHETFQHLVAAFFDYKRAVAYPRKKGR